MATGTIAAIKAGKGFGFIQRPNGEPDVFFHCRDLCDGLEFDEQLLERRVEFELINDSQKGPRARNVRAAK